VQWSVLQSPCGFQNREGYHPRTDLPLSAISNAERPVNTKQLCAHLQISERTLATMRAKGLIPYWRLSPKNYRYRISSVELALANRTVLPLTQGTRIAKMWPKPCAVFGALAPKF